MADEIGFHSVYVPIGPASCVSGSFVTLSSIPSNPVRANNGKAASIGLEKTEIVEQMIGGRSSGTPRC